ncbi:MAG: LamG domain-containing protein, partial [Sedimentisphaerales bacterium]|nr:LamG domain-containing protein [Sedimentisphaerales bacterium]
MCKKLVFLSFLLFLFAVSAQANLVAYYPFEGNANDMSGYGTVANGTLVGSPTFEAGPANFGQALKISTGNYVNCGADSKFSITGPITVCAWIKVNAWTTNWNAIVTKGDTTWRLHRNNATDNINFTCSGVNGGSATGTTNVRDGQWHHLAGVWDGANITLYVDGKVDGTAATTGGSTATTTLSMMIGENATYTGRPYDGWIDEVRIYNNALSAGEILAVMTGAKGLPSDPKPADKATEVPIDVGEISWTPGDFILADGGTHNVFFGTDETSVANAAIANTLGTTLYQGLDVNNVGLDQLEYGTTYYWRVDEVNIPSKPGTVKGNIWNFKTELEGYPLEPAQIINVTASENPVYPDEQEPNMTCNESGLDANDMHSTELATMWLGMADEPGQVWIQYEFDRV